MTRYPMLEAMRARRQQVEDDLSAPHRAAAEQAREIAHQEREARRGLEGIMRSELLPHVLREIGHKIGEAVHREIRKAVSQQRGLGGETTLTLPTYMLLEADPKSVVARVIEEWRYQTAPKIELRAFKGEAEVKNHTTVLDIRLPMMGYRHIVADQL